jgi:hypothetical protein
MSSISCQTTIRDRDIRVKVYSSVPISCCKISKAIFGDEKVFCKLIKTIKKNRRFGGFNILSCKCDPPCKVPTEEQLFNFWEKVNLMIRRLGNMSREEDIEKLCKGVLEVQLSFYDNPSGPDEYTCPFCQETQYSKGSETPTMGNFKHDVNCVYLIAKDLLTNIG